AGIVTTLTGLGVSELLVRRFAQHPETLKRDQGIALALELIAALIGVVVVAAAGSLFTFGIVDPRLLLIASVNIVATPFQTVLLATLRGREQHRGYAWFCAATNILCSLSGILVLVLGGDAAAFLAITIGVFTGTTLVSWKLSGPLPRLP